MDLQKTLEAIKETAEQRNISEEAVLDIVKEALRKGFIKKIKGDDDAYVEINMDIEKNKVFGVHKRFVVPNDYMTDYIDIRLEEAQKINKKAKVDDEITEIYDLTDDQEVGRGMALAIKTVLASKLAEAEKAALFERFHDKKDEIITGTVERIDSNGCTVKITYGPSVSLSRKDLIGDETFEVGDLIKLFVSDVSESGKGNQLKVTRANEGPLKRIFENEITELYDGTIAIKGIARLAGIRSKVSVVTLNENVDPIGAIIGPGGERITRIIKQLGNGTEKIDVFIYNENPALYIAEALRPAKVLGVYIPEGEKKATAVVENNQTAVAFGKKGANVRLASKITGYELTILEEAQALEQEVPFKTLDVINAENEERIRKEALDRRLKAIKEFEEKAKKEEVKSENTPVKEETTVNETKVIEVKAIEKPVEEPKKEEKVFVEVKTNQSIDELEKEIFKETRKDNKNQKKSSKRPKKILDEEIGLEKEEKVTTNKNQGMAIYTDEELAEMEAEELENEEYYSDDEDIDYDDYDSYYDEK